MAYRETFYTVASLQAVTRPLTRGLLLKTTELAPIKLFNEVRTEVRKNRRNFDVKLNFSSKFSM